MKLIALTTAGMNPVDGKVYLYTKEMDLSRFGFFEKGSYEEMINFTSRESLQKLKKGVRYTIDADIYMVHAITSERDNFAVFAFADKDYPKRVAYLALEEALTAFNSTVGESWKGNKDKNIASPAFKQVFMKFKSATEVDKLTLANKKVDETQAVLIQNMKVLLEGHEKLDDMLQKSEDLSAKTKMFAKNTEKMNKKCCNLI